MTVSIIIPVYNVEPYIEACLESVMRQTYGGQMECIIVDDASSDDSIGKCEQMISLYDGPIRFRVLHHQQNRGLSAARNTGTDATVGEYVYYLDGDDEITTDCIEKLIKPIIDDDSIEIVQGNYAWIKKANGSTTPLINTQNQIFDYNTHESARNCFFTRKMPYVWNKLISKAFIDRYHLAFREGMLWEDLLWLFYVAKYIRHFYLVPDITYIYHRRSGSITTSTPRYEKIKHWAMLYDEIANNLTSGEEDRESLYCLRSFMRCYLVSKGDNRFCHAYNVFFYALSNAGHHKDLWKLRMIHMIPEYAVTRWLFEITFKLYHLKNDQ